jgi:hypothetical protein
MFGVASREVLQSSDGFGPMAMIVLDTPLIAAQQGGSRCVLMATGSAYQ